MPGFIVLVHILITKGMNMHTNSNSVDSIYNEATWHISVTFMFQKGLRNKAPIEKTATSSTI